MEELAAEKKKLFSMKLWATKSVHPSQYLHVRVSLVSFVIVVVVICVLITKLSHQFHFIVMLLSVGCKRFFLSLVVGLITVRGCWAGRTVGSYIHQFSLQLFEIQRVPRIFW